MPVFLGKSGINRQIEDIYMGNGGANMNQKEIYLGSDGVNKRIYQKLHTWYRYSINYSVKPTKVYGELYYEKYDKVTSYKTVDYQIDSNGKITIVGSLPITADMYTTSIHYTRYIITDTLVYHYVSSYNMLGNRIVYLTDKYTYPAQATINRGNLIDSVKALPYTYPTNGTYNGYWYLLQ